MFNKQHIASFANFAKSFNSLRLIDFLDSFFVSFSPISNW